MPIVMSSETPLPMPRWVICSPSHMSSIVPAVMKITDVDHEARLADDDDLAVVVDVVTGEQLARVLQVETISSVPWIKQMTDRARNACTA